MPAVVVPVHDGAANIRPLAEGLGRLHIPVVLVFVDDGSRDESWLRIREACENPPATITVRGIRLDGNRGQQSALLAGMATCREDGSIVTMDDDLSHPVSLVQSLLDALDDGADLAYAHPPTRPGTPFRRLASRLHQYHLAILTGNSPSLRVGSFRAISADLAERILNGPFRWPYISAMALRLRPRPKWAMVASPEWRKGVIGRFPIRKLLMLELRLACHYGPWTGFVRSEGTGIPRSSGEVAAGWIAETAESGVKGSGE